MDATLNLLALGLAGALITLICLIAKLNDSCKRSENLNDALVADNNRLLKEYEKSAKERSELIKENKQLKARLLYERTQDDANVF